MWVGITLDVLFSLGYIKLVTGKGYLEKANNTRRTQSLASNFWLWYLILFVNYS